MHYADVGFKGWALTSFSVLFTAGADWLLLDCNFLKYLKCWFTFLQEIVYNKLSLQSTTYFFEWFFKDYLK